MGRYVAGDLPELDRLVEEAKDGIGRDIDSLGIREVASVVLGGGYGRGEGGAMPQGAGCAQWRLSNDLDFFAILRDGAGERACGAVARALESVSRAWTRKLGIDVDFAVKTPGRVRRDRERLMVQELLHGFADVAGEKGEKIFAGIERMDASRLPWMEAARLLMNRGAGLLLALESGDAAFVARNINKCVLGAGDAFLIAHGLYRYRAVERASVYEARCGGGLYASAVQWKFRPEKDPVCDWERARETWLAAKAGVCAAADGGARRRSLASAARWLVRRRTVGDVSTFALDPVLRILERVAVCVESRSAMPADLRRDWEIFN